MSNFFNRSVLRVIRDMDDSESKTIEFFDVNGSRKSVTLTRTMYDMAEYMLLMMIHAGYLQFLEIDGQLVAEILVENTLVMPEDKVLDVNPTLGNTI